MREDADPGQRAIHEDVRLASYDATWTAQFIVERERLLAHFPQLLEVEHFGSTAFCGMPAKPIIDMLAGVESMAIADALFEPIRACGYTTSRAFNAMLPDRRWFLRSANGRRTHHLHLVVYGSETWKVHLRFRDVLRSNGALAQRYGKLKVELAAKFSGDGRPTPMQSQNLSLLSLQVPDRAVERSRWYRASLSGWRWQRSAHLVR